MEHMMELQIIIYTTVISAEAPAGYCVLVKNQYGGVGQIMGNEYQVGSEEFSYSSVI